MELTGTLLWTLRDRPARRTGSMYTTDCYVDHVGDEWVVIIVRGTNAVLSELCGSEDQAARRAAELREILLQHGWTQFPKA